MIRLPQRETKLLVAVHGWMGVTLGLLLYAVIVTGTAAVFRDEITIWSAGRLSPEETFARPVDAAARRLAADTPARDRDDLDIRPSGKGNLSLFFHHHEMVDSERKARGVLYEVTPDGAAVARREGLSEDVYGQDGPGALGNFLIDLHVRLHLPNPYGLILTGVLGLTMLAAAVSGLMMHRHLITDLFTLRRGRDRLVAARDAHTVAATWALPHAFILAFTGAFFSFAGSVGIPLLAKVAFAGDQAALINALVGTPAKPDPTAADGADLDRILADARARADAPLSFVSIDHFGRRDARVSTRHEQRPGEIIGARLSYDGATGAFLGEKPQIGTRPSFGGAILGIAGPLHFGDFAGWWSKALWFSLGTASAYVTWSGLALWVRRRAAKPGWRLLGRVASWIGAGLPLALAASGIGFFVSLPQDAATVWTPAAFVIAAVLSLAWAVFLPAERIAPALFGAAGLLLIALPLLRIGLGGAGWSAAFAADQIAIPALDILMTIGGIVCLAPAIGLWRRLLAEDGPAPVAHAAE